jgi:hypothetical protein
VICRIALYVIRSKLIDTANVNFLELSFFGKLLVDEGLRDNCALVGGGEYWGRFLRMIIRRE